MRVQLLRRVAQQGHRGVAVALSRSLSMSLSRSTPSLRSGSGSGYHGAVHVSKRLMCAPATPPTPPKGDKDAGEEQVQAAAVDKDKEAPVEENVKKGSSDNLPIRRIEEDDDDYYDDFESSGSKNAWKRYVSYTFGLSLLGLFGWAGYSLAVELFGRGAPNNLFSETFEKVRYNDEILLMTGDPMKAYGQDSGRRSEGRRNHVANRYYLFPNFCYMFACLLFRCSFVMSNSYF